jgi:transposase
MTRTRKWEFVKQEANRLVGLGLTAQAIADKLEVNKSTVTRWIAAGKLTRPPARELPAVPPRQAPAAWAKSVRAEYALDSTDEQLVTLGEAALSLSRDMTVSAQVQLTAGDRFRAIVKQLQLGTRSQKAPAKDETPAVPEAVTSKKNPRIRTPKGDPRALYMLPKVASQ